MNRVVVTGMGAVTPVGNDVATFLKNIFSGKLDLTLLVNLMHPRLGSQLLVK